MLRNWVLLTFCLMFLSVHAQSLFEDAEFDIGSSNSANTNVEL